MLLLTASYFIVISSLTPIFNKVRPLSAIILKEECGAH